MYTCCIRNQDFFFFKVYYTTSSTLNTSNGKHLNNLTAKQCTTNVLFSHCSFCPLSSISVIVCCPLQHYRTIWDFKATDESTRSFLRGHLLYFCILKTHLSSQCTLAGSVPFELKWQQSYFGDKLTLISKPSLLILCSIQSIGYTGRHRKTFSKKRRPNYFCNFL